MSNFHHSRNISPATATSQGPVAALNRAQQFEDEKRRIMQSCFSKLDTDGSRAYLLRLPISYHLSCPMIPCAVNANMVLFR